MKTNLPSAACLLTALTLNATAATIPLQEATITRTINDVRVINPRVGSAPAHIAQVIKDDMGVKTGIKSRAELLFQDNTLTRLGAESYFTFRPGTREMSLDQGTLLLQVPKDHGGATIRSASVTASITGTTVLLEHLPNKSIKFLVLEGSAKLSLTNRLHETLSLNAGRMLIVPGDAKKLPTPVAVDVRRLIKTSSLVNPELFGTTAKNKPAPLPSMALIAGTVEKQDSQKKDGKLQETNLVILGKGTKVIAADAALLAAIDTVGTQAPAPNAKTSGKKRAKGGNNSEDGSDMAEALSTAAGARSAATEATEADMTTSTVATESSSTPPLKVPVPPILNPVVWSPPVVGGPGPGLPVLPAMNLLGPDAINALSVPSLTLSATVGTFPGALYRGTALDGSASLFLFGTTTSYDTGSGFDQRFGYGTGITFANPGVAVFQSDPVTLDGPLNFSPGTFQNIALVGKAGLTVGGTVPATINLAGLQSFFLGSAGTGGTQIQTGSVIATTDPAFTTLGLYGRSPVGPALDSLMVRGNISLPTADLIADGMRDVAFRPGATVHTREAHLFAGRDLSLFTGLTANAFTAATIRAHAARNIEIGGNVSATNFFADAAGFEIHTGSLTADNIQLTLTGAFAPGGTSANLNLDPDGALGNSTPLLTVKNLTINAGGSVSLTADDLTRLRISTTPLQTFSVTAGTLDFTGATFTVPEAATASVKAVNQLNAASTSLSGFDSITVQNGDLNVNSLYAGDVQVQNGSLLAGGSMGAQNATASGDIRVTLAIVAPLTNPLNAPITLRAADFRAGTGISLDGAVATATTAPGDGGTINLFGTRAEFKNSRINGANLSGGNGIAGNIAGNGGTINAGTTASPLTQDVLVDAPITATSGRPAGSGTVGAGGTFSAVANGLVQVKNSIVVSSDSSHPDTALPAAALDRKSASGGIIRLTSLKTSGVGVELTNTSQLVAVLNSSAPGAGGKIQIASAGAAINVAGKLRADRGSIDIRNNGAGGNIAFNQADLSASVIKAGTIGGNGTITIGGNSTFSASSLLYLYAPGSNGHIHFSDNTTINGTGLKYIAANQVTVDNNKIVTVSGPPAGVFTNVPNYSPINGGNGTTTGRFQGTGAVTLPYALRPAGF